jgi:hypothetical protein
VFLQFSPFFSELLATDRRLRVMITKHDKHGEVYVLASEKKFHAVAKSCREILVRHFGIFDFSVRAAPIDRVTAVSLDDMRAIRLDLQALDRCGRMSEQRYQRLVMIGFRKDGVAQCSPKFAESSRHSPMNH